MDVIAILKDIGLINQKFVPNPDGYPDYPVEEWDDDCHAVNVAQLVLEAPALWDATKKAYEISWLTLAEIRKIREKAGFKDDQKVIQCPHCDEPILLENES